MIDSETDCEPVPSAIQGLSESIAQSETIYRRLIENEISFKDKLRTTQGLQQGLERIKNAPTPVRWLEIGETKIDVSAVNETLERQAGILATGLARLDELRGEIATMHSRIAQLIQQTAAAIEETGSVT